MIAVAVKNTSWYFCRLIEHITGVTVSIHALPERPYPLQWPEGWGRTPVHQRTNPPYRAPLEDTRFLILEELRLLITGRSSGQIRCTLSSDMITRRDGTFYTNPEEPRDPGAAVWWVDARGDLCAIACDAWNTVQGNLRAIALNIKHMRAVERTKATQIFARMTQNFKVHALAAMNPVPTRPKCADILGLEAWPVPREVIESAYRQRARKLAKTDHPDVPGSDPTKLVELSGAYVECCQLAG